VVAQDAINRLGLPQRRDRAERPPAAPDGDRQTALTFYHGNMLVTVMQDVMTHEEKSLVRAHHVDTLDIIRRDFQETMEADCCAAVEQLTGRTVVGFVSGHRVEPDILSELFVLDTPLSTCAARLSVPRRRAGRSHWSDEWVPGPVWIGPGLARRYGASLGEAVIDRSRDRSKPCPLAGNRALPAAHGPRAGSGEAFLLCVALSPAVRRRLSAAGWADRCHDYQPDQLKQRGHDVTPSPARRRPVGRCPLAACAVRPGCEGVGRHAGVIGGRGTFDPFGGRRLRRAASASGQRHTRPGYSTVLCRGLTSRAPIAWFEQRAGLGLTRTWLTVANADGGEPCRPVPSETRTVRIARGRSRCLSRPRRKLRRA
jgi:uncharacterized protein YbcI